MTTRRSPEACRSSISTPRRSADNAEVTERMIRKLRAGMMPPAVGERRARTPTRSRRSRRRSRRGWTRRPLAHPNPGRRPFQRLNRAEYMRAVRDLVDVDVDVTAFLSPDTVSNGFDNIADVQSFSPTVTEGYLRAASRIATIAVGDRTAHASEVTYKIPRTTAQLKHVDGAPWGTRGGLSVVHTFPADGDYSFRIMLHSVPSGRLYASDRARRADRSVRERRARGAPRHRLPHERSRSERYEPDDAARSRERGTAAGDGGVPAALRRPGRRSASRRSNTRWRTHKSASSDTA